MADLDARAAAGHEARLRQEQASQRRSQVELEQTDASALLRAKRSTSPLAHALRLGVIARMFFWVLWGTTFAFAFPAFRAMFAGGEVSGYDMRTGSHWHFVLARDGALALSPLAVMTLVLAAYGALRLRANSDARRTFEVECGWLDALPFALEGYVTLLGTTTHRRFDFEIFYVDAEPESEFMRDLCATLPNAAEYRRLGRDGVKVELPADWKADDEDGFPLHRFTHTLVEALLRPLHARFPIRKVMVRER